MTVQNDMDRFHLVIDVITRLGLDSNEAIALEELMQTKLITHRDHIRIHGVDMPEVSGWSWHS